MHGSDTLTNQAMGQYGKHSRNLVIPPFSDGELIFNKETSEFQTSLQTSI
jgi:hypothetical protein